MGLLKFVWFQIEQLDLNAEWDRKNGGISDSRSWLDSHSKIDIFKWGMYTFFFFVFVYIILMVY